jgi:anti-sigma factor RsiW
MDNNECNQFQMQIADYEDGRLGAEDEKKFKEHLSTCSECQKELLLDQRLCRLAGSMPSIITPVPSFSQAYRFNSVTQKKPVLVFAYAGMAILCILLVFARYEHPVTHVSSPIIASVKPTVSSAPAPSTDDESSFTRAHNLLSMSGGGWMPDIPMSVSR